MSTPRDRNRWNKPDRHSSHLLKHCWATDDLGAMRVIRPGTDVLKGIDELWPENRKEGDPEWDWSLLCAKTEEKFVLVDLAGNPLFIWAARSAGPMKLSVGLSYRLDYIEVNPVMRASKVGIFGMTLVASRALECGATCVVLGSLPSVTGFYIGLGASLEPISGWKPPSGTVPACLTYETMRELEEVANGFRKEEES